MNMSVRKLTRAAIVAALYTVLSYFAGFFGLTFGVAQFRFSEALCVLPFFFPETVWGLFVGCVLTNLLSTFGVADVVFGSLATLLAGLCTARARSRWLAPLPPVIFNGVVVGALSTWVEVGLGSGFLAAFAANSLLIAAEEAAVCYVLGSLLLTVLPRIPFFARDIPAAKLPRPA